MNFRRLAFFLLSVLVPLLVVQSSSAQEKFAIRSSGVPLGVKKDTLYFYEDEKILAYNIASKKSRVLLTSVPLLSGFTLPCSSDFSFVRLGTDRKSRWDAGDYRIVWAEVPKLEAVQTVYSGSIDELSCSFDKTLLRKIENETGLKRYSSGGLSAIGSRNWGADGYFISEVTSAFDKSSTVWPLDAYWIKPDGSVREKTSIQPGPWLWNQGFFDSLKNFSCGTSCYTHFRSFAVRDSIYVRAFGSAIPSKRRGVYRRAGGRWRKIASGNFSYPPIVSADGRYLILKDSAREELILVFKLP